MNDVITVENLNVTFGNNIALRNVSFTVKPQEVTVIIGPNGSGKSTLIKALLGLIPYTGEIKIFSKNVQKALHHIGYVPQYFEFDRNFPITTKEFLMLSAGSAGEGRVDEVLSEVGMSDAKDRMLGKLSGGQLQRVLIARAILHNPEVLILDEPTAGIDVEGVKDFYELLTHLNEKHHVAIVLVSHEINVVYKFAHKIVCLNKDMLCAGDPKKVLATEIMKELYGDDLIIHEHEHNHNNNNHS